MISEEKELERYKLLHTVVLHESKAMWETSQLFLLSNTILATIIGANMGNISQQANKFIFWLLPLLGLLISILWFFSYNRTSRYYKYRMAQARKIEPHGFNIFKGDPKQLSDGNTVEIEDEEYSARVFSFNFRSLIIGNIIIILFIGFFLAMTIYFFPENFDVATR